MFKIFVTNVDCKCLRVNVTAVQWGKRLQMLKLGTRDFPSDIIIHNFSLFFIILSDLMRKWVEKVCMCVCMREREREKNASALSLHFFSFLFFRLFLKLLLLLKKRLGDPTRNLLRRKGIKVTHRTPHPHTHPPLLNLSLKIVEEDDVSRQFWFNILYDFSILDNFFYKLYLMGKIGECFGAAT